MPLARCNGGNVGIQEVCKVILCVRIVVYKIKTIKNLEKKKKTQTCKLLELVYNPFVIYIIKYFQTNQTRCNVIPIRQPDNPSISLFSKKQFEILEFI